jgi:dTDP-4-dehydrorhamnose 3,5-epimerase
MAFDRTIEQSDIFAEVIIVKNGSFQDLRGKLWTTFDDELQNYFKETKEIIFKHDKFATNKKHVLRGIHGDSKSWKLVTVLSGKVFQVVVDCRPKSETYLNHFSIILNSKEPCSILLPPGFGNGFLSLTSNSIYHYKLAYLGQYSDADVQFTYCWSDPRIAIDWPVSNPILSERDKWLR